MPILDNEILWRPSALISDSLPSQNGGRMSTAQLISGVKNNLFPDVSQFERTNGSVKWRKAFIHIHSAQESALLNAKVFLDALTPAGDFVTLHPGTQSDTEDQITARPYGIGTLKEAALSGAITLRINGEHNAEYANLQPFRIGDLIRIADRPSTSGNGNEEWHTVNNVNYSGDDIELELASPLASNYAIQNTLISSVISIPSVSSNWSAFTVTSANGNFDIATVGNLIAHNKGAIEQDWTLHFNSSENFTVSGNLIGMAAAPGSISADYAPINPATGTPYFTLRAAAWSGTFNTNDSISFRTSPAAIPLWYRRRVPPGTFSLANDFASVALHGESA